MMHWSQVGRTHLDEEDNHCLSQPRLRASLTWRRHVGKRGSQSLAVFGISPPPSSFAVRTQSAQVGAKTTTCRPAMCP
jgi:hypothetical protein